MFVGAAQLLVDAVLVSAFWERLDATLCGLLERDFLNMYVSSESFGSSREESPAESAQGGCLSDDLMELRVVNRMSVQLHEVGLPLIL